MRNTVSISITEMIEIFYGIAIRMIQGGGLRKEDCGHLIVAAHVYGIGTVLKYPGFKRTSKKVTSKVTGE